MDNNSKKIFFFILLTSVFCGTYGQSFKWGIVKPENEGFSTEKLYAMRDTLAQHQTTSILVIRNDRIVLEWYADGWDLTKKHGTASLAKALVGGMSLVLALNDGRMQVDDPACMYVPEWKDDTLKSRITIRQLATHTSGIEDAEISRKEMADFRTRGIEIKDKHMDIPGWKGDFWRKDPDPFTISRDKAPIIFTPGTRNSYSNPGMAMLAYAITASYRNSSYKNIRMLLGERIYKPIGINDDEWEIGYGQTYDVDGLELVADWGGGSFTPRAAARIGRLMLNNGRWEGKQLIDSSRVKYLVSNGLAWYTNLNAKWPLAPPDLFYGAGAGNQILIIIPSMHLIVVRNGQDMNDQDKREGSNYGVLKYLVNPLMEASNKSSSGM